MMFICNTVHRFPRLLMHGLLTLQLGLLGMVGVMAQVDPLQVQDTRSPYQTVYTHLYYLQSDSYDAARSAHAIPLAYDGDSTDRVQAAIQLKQVLDGRGLFVHMGVLPERSDYLDSTSRRHTYTLFPEVLPEVYLERIDGEWYYSMQTLDQLEDLHHATYPLGTDLWIGLLGSFGQYKVMGWKVWQLAGLLGIGLLGLVLFVLLRRVLMPFIKRLLRRWVVDKVDVPMKYVRRLASALTLLVVIQTVLWLLSSLMLPIESAVFADRTLRVLRAVVLALLLVRGVDFFMYYLTQLVERTDNRMDDQAVPLIKNLLKGIIWLGAIFQMLRLLEVDITALIAGVSIGSLAIAFAAQDAIKHLIGSVMIFIDRPFHVGDYVIGDGFQGEVAEVGFRTTRIRTIDTSIIAVPNGNITNMSIENLGARPYRLFNTTLTMTYASDPAELQDFVGALKRLIIDHPEVREDGHHVVVRALADSSINVLFRAYLDVDSFARELLLKEHIIYEMMALAKQHGLSFAYPSQSIYIEQMPESDQKS